MTVSPLTLIVGASQNPERYAWRAAGMLHDHGHRIAMIGSRRGELLGQEILTGTPEMERPDTITLYIGPAIQEGLIDYLLSLKPRRIIFNPGTENVLFEQKARENGILVEEACTLVLLSTNQY